MKFGGVTKPANHLIRSAAATSMSLEPSPDKGLDKKHTFVYSTVNLGYSEKPFSGPSNRLRIRFANERLRTQAVRSSLVSRKAAGDLPRRSRSGTTARRRRFHVYVRSLNCKSAKNENGFRTGLKSPSVVDRVRCCDSSACTPVSTIMLKKCD